MDYRRLKPPKPGEHLKAAELAAVYRGLGVRPSSKHGYQSSTVNASTTRIPQATIEFRTDEDLEENSIFAAVGSTDNYVLPVFKAVKNGWGIWTNGPIPIASGEKGTAYPLDFFAPTLVRLTSDEEFKPNKGEICGIADDFSATVKRGGLLMLNTDPNEDLGWCVRFDGPIDALAQCTESIAKRDRGLVKLKDLDDANYFSDSTLTSAFNMHNAGLQIDDYVRLSLCMSHGITATKFNGGMWIGTVGGSDIEANAEGAANIDGSNESVTVKAPPEGLVTGQAINIIEYDFNTFYAYPIECA